MSSTHQQDKQLLCHADQLALILAKESPLFVFNFVTHRIAQVEATKKICCIPETCAKLDEEIAILEKILNDRKFKPA